jgi:hypothetical protein
LWLFIGALEKEPPSMKTLLKSATPAALLVSLPSCGLPTAAVRTLRNAEAEVAGIYDGTSSAYADVR